jgi:hypothetical protein
MSPIVMKPWDNETTERAVKAERPKKQTGQNDSYR